MTNQKPHKYRFWRVAWRVLSSPTVDFGVNVDLLEQELHAMSASKEEYIEKPLWVRLVLNLPSLGRLGRSDLTRHEASLVAYAFVAYAFSFIVPKVEFPLWSLTTVDAMYFSAFSALFLDYIASITLRLRDKFNTKKTTSV